MLTLVINPGGQRRVVTIAEALYHLGYTIKGRGGWPERTPEERRRHKEEARRACRERQQRKREGA